jgi:hypothetical protein
MRHGGHALSTAVCGVAVCCCIGIDVDLASNTVFFAPLSLEALHETNLWMKELASFLAFPG